MATKPEEAKQEPPPPSAAPNPPAPKEERIERPPPPPLPADALAGHDQRITELEERVIRPKVTKIGFWGVFCAIVLALLVFTGGLLVLGVLVARNRISGEPDGQ